MAQSGAGTISVHCACGKKLKAPASAVGRKAKCPGCGNVLVIEAPAPADELNDALYELADQEKVAAKTAPAAVACPECHRPMAQGAVLCTNCGFDTRKGKKLATVAETAKRPAPVAGKAGVVPGLATSVEPAAAEPTGSLLKGTAFSAAFAAVGALLWFLIAKGTGLQIGFVAWGIGLASGFGMLLGYNGHSAKGGTIAGLLAVAGIFAGKLMVFTMVVLPAEKKDWAKLNTPDEPPSLQEIVFEEQLAKKGVTDPEDATEEQDAAAKKETLQIISKMDAKTKQAKIAAHATPRAQLPKELPFLVEAIMFAWFMFGCFSIFFMLLAIASAYKIATYGGQVQT